MEKKIQRIQILKIRIVDVRTYGQLEAFTDLEILWKFSWKYYFQWNFSWFMDSWKRRRLEIRALSSDCWPDEGGV